MRTADHVFHKPSGETWVVAWADHETGYMAPCGWPECQAMINDCTVIYKATDEESAALARRLADSGRSDSGRALAIFASARRALEEE